ncbi:MAG: MFS transporter [Aggregatilineales bacterium]
MADKRDPRLLTGPENYPDANLGPIAGIPNADEGMTVAASLSGTTIRELFGNRNFIPLWLGQMMSYVGDQFTLVAALAVVSRLAGSSSGLIEGGIAVANAAPSIVLGLIGGVLVDRLDRKLVMIGADVARGLVLFSLLLVGNESSRLWLFFVALATTGAAGTLFYPARASTLPSIVSKRHLAAANALLESGFVIALVVGSLLAGVLIRTFGAGLAFAFNGGAYLFSALMIMLMRIPRRVLQVEVAHSALMVRRELIDGLRYIWRTRSMRYIMALSVSVASSIGAVLILALNYLRNQLQIDESAYGLVIAILGVGIVIGGVLIQRLSRYLPTNRLVGVAMALNGLAILAFIAQPTFIIVCGLTALIGFSVVVARAVLGTLVQAIPPEEYRGRVQSAFNLIFSAPLALSIALAAVLSQVFADREWIVFAGFGGVLLLTAWLAVTLLRGIDEAVYNENAG